jgi:hypothetical protein
MFTLDLRIFDLTLIRFRPILVRLTQIACFKSVASSVKAQDPPKASLPVGWKGWEEAVRLLPGAVLEESQRVDRGLQPRSSTQTKKTTLVVFLGGCTYTEITALRYLSKQYEGKSIIFYIIGREFLILTTNLINGANIVESLVESSLLL